jgi:hypothetical protein
MSQTAIVVCCIVFAIMIVSIVLALAGDTDGAGALVFLSMIIGGIIACVFHRRWPWSVMWRCPQRQHHHDCRGTLTP